MFVSRAPIAETGVREADVRHPVVLVQIEAHERLGAVLDRTLSWSHVYSRRRVWNRAERLVTWRPARERENI